MRLKRRKLGSYQARSKAICNFGAGMDAFAFRRSDLMEQLRVFELTTPPHKNISFDALQSWGGNILKIYISSQLISLILSKYII